MHDISVFHNIFFSFYCYLSGFFTGNFGFILLIIIQFNYLCFNKATLKIGMNYACSLRCFPAFTNRPGPYFFLASCKISNQIQEFRKLPGSVCAGLVPSDHILPGKSPVFRHPARQSAISSAAHTRITSRIFVSHGVFKLCNKRIVLVQANLHLHWLHKLPA